MNIISILLVLIGLAFLMKICFSLGYLQAGIDDYEHSIKKGE